MASKQQLNVLVVDHDEGSNVQIKDVLTTEGYQTEVLNDPKQVVEAIKPEGFGVIVRTVADSKDQKTIKRDYNRLWDAWKDIERLSKTVPGPVVLYSDLTTTDSVIRDLLTPNIDKVIIDSKDIFKRLNNYLKEVSPSLAKWF